MKIRTRIFLAYLLIFGVGFYSLIHWVLGDLRVRYLEGVEESLVDQANILAEWTGIRMTEGRFEPGALRRVFDAVYKRRLSSRIYEVTKTRVDLKVYLTDRTGRVIFDSDGGRNEGADFSRWNDVHMTLRGDYGVRSTRTDPKNPLSSELYVAAPVRVHGELAGVLTVVKPMTGINRFMDFAKQHVLRVGLMATIAVLTVGFLTVSWLTRPVRELTRYADEIRNGRRAKLPRLDRTEIGDMGRAFEGMREALEGKKYVEQYIQTFAHEIKSPVSAIRGAAELLGEPMPEDQRRRFLSNILDEAERIQRIVERLLELAALENRNRLQKIAPVFFNQIVGTLVDGMEAVFLKKQIRVETRVPEDHRILGDPFLIRQALLNLIQNALDFSPAGGGIVIHSRARSGFVELAVEDQGPGVPKFATEKAFNKFFSLQRPGSGKKSTGLGLNFVREIAELHGGGVRLENRTGGGARAVLSVPQS